MYKVYQVQENDTLESIANRFNTTVEQLSQINNFPMNYQPRLGEQIVVPMVEETTFTQYTIVKGDNLYDIAKRYQVDLNELLLVNGLKQGEFIYPGETLMIPSRSMTTYMVMQGDTLESVSNDMNVNINDLVKDNDTIYLLPGQMLLFQKNR